MRSRPDLTVYLTPPDPCPGDRLRTRIRLESRSETPYDAIDVVLVGEESRYKRTTSNGKTAVRRYHRREIVRLGASFPAGVLKPGTFEQDVLVDIPADAPPTYRSSLSTIAYRLEVRVHIPWWPDRHESYLVTVRPHAEQLGAPRPRVVTTQHGEHRGDAPVLELSLEDDRVPIGGTLSGAVAITGLGDRRLRRVELSCVAIESALVHSTAGPRETDRRTWTLHEGTPPEGASLPFRLAIPADFPPTFASTFLRVDHLVQAVAVVAFGSDLAVQLPVLSIRPAAERPGAPLPLVGRERHLGVWRAAVDQVRLSGVPSVRFDPDRAVASFEAHGVEVTVAEEHREGLGPCLVAELTWPSLGLDLRVAERRWTDFGRKIEALDRELQERFTVRAREPAQAARLLDPGLREALQLFDEAGLDDGGAVVLRKGGVYQVAGLSRFMAQAHHLATQLARAAALIPPPAALAPAWAEWQRFAREQEARLCPGDLSLQGWAVRGVPLSLDHRWDAARPVESRVWTPRPDGADAAAWSEALAKATGGVGIQEEGRVGVALPLLADPDAAAAAAEAFALAATRLLGGAVGPYR